MQIKAMQRAFGALVLIFLIIIADQSSKYYILNVIKLNQIQTVEISKIFDLTMVWNYGVSFGALKAGNDFGRWALVGLAAIICAAFFAWLLREARILSRIALCFVIGGAIGNMIDRIMFGAVADFLDFSGLGFPWVFNIADSAVVFGAGLLMLDMVLTPEEKPNPNESEQK